MLFFEHSKIVNTPLRLYYGSYLSVLALVACSLSSSHLHERFVSMLEQVCNQVYDCYA